MKQVKTVFRGYFFIVVLVPALFIGGWLFMQCSPGESNIRHVVLISIDSCRADHLGCYGFNKPTTPNIDGIAAEGVLFENVISPVPITLPAHISMFTGITPLSHGIHDNMNYVLINEKVTLAEIFKGNGYRTGGIVSAFALNSRFGIAQGFEFYQDDFGKAQKTGLRGERPGDETTGLAVTWLEEHKDEKFFLFLHYNDPGKDYNPPGPYTDQFGDDPYSGEIAFVDHCIGKVITKLKELGIYDSSLLIITGDHGEMLGEHSETGHSYFIYDSALKVPLIVRMPGKVSNKPVRIEETIGLIDVMPGICELLDFNIPPRIQGISFAPHLQQKVLSRESRYFYIESMMPTYLGANALLGIRSGEWKYISTTNPELYNLKNDPKEQVNLINKEPQIQEAYREILAKLIKEHQAEAPGRRIVPDLEMFNKLTSLGYVGADVTKDTLITDLNKPDPKNLIELHESLQEVLALKLEKNIPGAKQMLADLERKQPHFRVYNLLGELALLENNIDRAIEYYSRSLQLNAAGYHANLDMGTMMTRKGDLPGAVAYFKKAIESQPFETKALRNLGVVLEQMGKLPEARFYFSRVLQLDPRDAIALRHMGSIMLKMGHEQEAIRYFSASINIYRNQPLTMGWLAQLKTANPTKSYYDPVNALSMALEACRLTNFKHPELLCILVSVYIASGQATKALETAEQALTVTRAAGKQHLVQQLLKQIKILKQKQTHDMGNQQ